MMGNEVRQSAAPLEVSAAFGLLVNRLILEDISTGETSTRERYRRITALMMHLSVVMEDFSFLLRGRIMVPVTALAGVGASCKMAA